MTAQGTSTAQATTQMRALLQELGTEGTNVNKVFQDINGEGFLDFIAGGGNVAEAMQMLEEHSAAAGTPIQDLFGNVRAGLGALQLTGAGMETFVSNLEEMNNSAGATEAAYERMNSGMARIFEVLGSMWESFKIKAGAALAPVVETAALALQNFAENILPLLEEKFTAVADAVGKLIEIVSGGGDIFAVFEDGSTYIEKLFESFGMGEDAARELALKIIEIKDAITEFGANVQAAAGPIVEWIASFVSLKDVLLAVGLLIGGVVVVALAGFLAGMLPIIAVVTAVIGVIALLRNAWESDFMGIQTAINNFIDVLKNLGNYFRYVVEDGDFLNDFLANLPASIQPIAEIMGKVIDVFSKFIENIRSGQAPLEALQNAFGTFYTEARSALDQLVSFLAPTFDRIKEAFAGLGESMGPVGGKLDVLKEAFGRLMTALQPVAALVGAVLVVAFKLLGEIVAQVFTRIGPIVATVVTFITGQIDALTKIIDGLIQFVTGVFQGDWESAWDGLTQVVEGVVDGIEGTLDALVEIVDNIVGAIWDSIANLIEDLTGKAIPSWEEFKTAVEDAFNGAVEAVQNGIESITTFFEDLVADVKEWGKNIIDDFVGALEEAPTMITDTLQGWYQSFVDWVTNIDWYQVGYDVATFVIEGLEFLTEDLPRIITEWATNFMTTISDKASEWLAAGVEIVEKIVEGLVEFPEKAGTEVKTWPEAISGFISDAADTFLEVGSNIVEKIVEGAEAFAEFMSEEVSLWPGQISTFITENLAAFMQIGKDIGAGIREGIRSMLNGIKQMVKDVISGAETAGREQAIAESPSRLFAALGADLMAGLAVGIFEGTSEVISAITAAFSDIDAKAVAKVAEIITNLSAMIAGAIASMRQLAALGMDDIDDSMIQPFVDFVGSLVTAISEIAVELDGVRNQTLKMVEVMTKTAEMVLAAIDAIRSLQRMTIPTGIEKQLVALVAFIGLLTKSMAELAVEMDGFRDQTLKFAEVVEKTVAIIAPTIAAMVVLSKTDFGPVVSGWHLSEQIGIFSRIVGTLIREFLFAALEVGSLAEMVEDFAKAVEAVIDVIVPTINTMIILSRTDFSAIVGQWTGGTTPLAEQMKIIRNIVRTLIRLFADAADEFSGSLVEAVEDFAKAVEAVVDILVTTIDAMIILSQTDFGSIVGEWTGTTNPLAEQMKVIRNIVRTLIRLFADAAVEFGTDLVESIEAFADAAGAVLDTISQTLEVLQEIIAFQAPFDRVRQWLIGITLKIGVIAEVVKIAVDSFARAADGFGEELSAAIQEFADAAGAAFEEVAADMTESMSTAVQNFTDAASGILELIEDAIAAMAAISELSPVAEIGGGPLLEKIRKLSDFVDELVAAFEEVAADMTTEVSAAVQSFADAANSILGIVGPGIEALLAIAEFPGIEGIGAKTSKFAGHMSSAITVLATNMDFLSNLLGEKVPVAKKFAEDTQAIFTAVEAIAGGLAAIAAVEMSDTTPQMEYILAQAQIIAEKLQGASETLNGSVIQAARDFALAVAEMVTAVQDALNNIEALVASNAPGSLQTILDAMVKAMNNAAPDAGAAGKAIGDAFNDGLFRVLDGIPADVAAIVAAIIAALRAGVNDAGRAGQEIGRAVESALNAAEGAIRQAGVELGSSAGDGIISGLNSKLSGVRAAAAALAAAARAGAAEELEIGSPSRVFERLGEQALAGFERPFLKPISPMQLVTGAATTGTSYSNNREGDINIYLGEIGTGVGTANIKQTVKTAVSQALRESGRKSESRIRMR
jgi:phage-related protein